MISLVLLFDKRHSEEGWICYKSISEQNPSIKIYVLCLDEQIFQEAESTSAIPIKLSELEATFPELLSVKPARPWNAYTQTCKVFLPSYVFKHFNEQKICYVDSDMYFWGDFLETEKVFGSHSFMVAPREEEPPKKQGRYNGGFFVCSNDEYGTEFLKWWQEKTIEWCLWGSGPNNRFGEEGYLNIFHDQPDKFKNILISQHPGFNLSYWNYDKHLIELDNGKIVIDKIYPLICFHYQGFIIRKGTFWPGTKKMTTETERFIYNSYFQKFQVA